MFVFSRTPSSSPLRNEFHYLLPLVCKSCRCFCASIYEDILVIYSCATVSVHNFNSTKVFQHLTHSMIFIGKPRRGFSAMEYALQKYRAIKMQLIFNHDDSYGGHNIAKCLFFVFCSRFVLLIQKTEPTLQPAKQASVTNTVKDSSGCYETAMTGSQKKKKAIEMTVINLEKSTNPCQRSFHSVTISTQMSAQGQWWPVSPVCKLTALSEHVLLSRRLTELEE